MSLGGRLHRVTTRLLVTVVLITVVSVASSAWFANWQSNARFQDSLQRELVKRPFILAELTELSATEAWPSGLANRVKQLSRQTGLRITVTSEDPNFEVIDVDERYPERLTEPAGPPLHTIDPAAANQEQLDQFATRNRALRLCFDVWSVTYDLKALPTGLERPTPRKDLSPTAALQAAFCRTNYGQELEKFEPVKVSLAELSLDSTALLGGGLPWRLVGIIAGVLLLAVASTIFIARQILRPVGLLTAATQRMRAGLLTERVPVTSSDELGQLSESFNSMASSLEEADKLRKRMTSDIAHELRTPLSNIRGYLEAAQDGVAPLTTALIDSLHEDTLLLQALVEDLQELTQAEAGRLQLEIGPTDLADLLTSVVNAHSSRATTAGLRIILDAQPIGPVEIDSRRIRQVVTNLVENALRHTSAGGQITVAVRRSADTVEVAVIDTGTGIAPEHLAHLFDRFYRVDSSRNRATGGSGLGLAITRELVAAHDGTITVTSQAGIGTTFTVTLPASAIIPEVATRQDNDEAADLPGTVPPDADTCPADDEFDEFHVHVS